MVQIKQTRLSIDLSDNYEEISKLCREGKQPVNITVHGREDTVLVGLAEFEQMKAELELLRMLAEAEEDVCHGRVAPV